jgi:V8-like Glu-specific endopeptidase
MLRLASLATSASILGLVLASPSPLRHSSDVGFDPSLKDLFGSDSIVPEMRVIDPHDSNNLTTLAVDTPLEPFIPSTEDLAAILDKRFIVGQDDRKYNSDTSYPFSAIGKVVWSNGGYCSGALVGPRHVLTARHCLPEAGVSMTFAPGFDNGAKLGTAKVQIAVTVPKQSGACNTKSDWSVLVIDQRFGDRLGYFGVKAPDRGRFGQGFLHQGYPSDRDNGQRPFLHSNTRVLAGTSLDCDASGPFYTDTDTWGGQSGGPFWETTTSGPYIWGTLSITVTSSASTYAGWASGNVMMQAITNLRSEYP